MRIDIPDAIFGNESLVVTDSTRDDLLYLMTVTGPDRHEALIAIGFHGAVQLADALITFLRTCPVSQKTGTGG